ncbi:hypothetical protein pqer_cds_667 [Pandoravirus quercus]|uniref:F-box domain containing protein n=1 Tax=Pandoravirus quercus TaxID=2107709 RepID=A0A2U7U9I0_9VIRU|nr:hypothetical protein pqer_cds_667 [Pandoravirus quercus]AVK75089.1 hypothetical protein pqer_cds_667 [Pandoravirus quercus]
MTAVADSVSAHSAWGASSPMSLCLTDLPSEIAALIMDAIDDPRDFCACISTCRWFRVPPGPTRLANLFAASDNVTSFLVCEPSINAIKASFDIIKDAPEQRRICGEHLFREAARRGRVDVLDWMWEHRRALLPIDHRRNAWREQLRELGIAGMKDDHVWPLLYDVFGDACLARRRESVDWFLRRDIYIPRFVHGGMCVVARERHGNVAFFAYLHALFCATMPDCAGHCAHAAVCARRYNPTIWVWLQTNCPESTRVCLVPDI